MKTIRSLLVLAAVVAALLSGPANAALPGVAKPVPNSSVETCISQIRDAANFDEAVRVRHVVDPRERRVDGHVLIIDTTVFGADNSEIIRGYATTCVVSKRGETKLFRLKEKGVRG